jgi:hypothetical protein
MMNALSPTVLRFTFLIFLLSSGCAGGPPSELVKSTGFLGTQYIEGQSVSGKRAIITKTKIQVNGKDHIQWRLENPVIHNDNGKIILTISP